MAFDRQAQLTTVNLVNAIIAYLCSVVGAVPDSARGLPAMQLSMSATVDGS